MADLPPKLERMGRVPHRLLTWGVPMGPLKLLRTRGRRSGLPRTTPVAILQRPDGLWLVSPFGVTGWVRNVRSAGGAAEVGRGRRFRPIRVTEIDDERTAEVLRDYRKKFGIVPFVRDAFHATPADGLDAFRREAARHPVFLADAEPPRRRG